MVEFALSENPIAKAGRDNGFFLRYPLDGLIGEPGLPNDNEAAGRNV